jgi:hypothetical protein
MGKDPTPGCMVLLQCPNCEEPILFVLGGGPRRLPCRKCQITVALEVVHDGRKWTTRRVRQEDVSAGPS